MPTLPGGAPMSIAGGVREFARATPRAVAVIDGDRTLTFAALDERASRLGQLLLGAGLPPGDRVAVLLGNRLEYLEVAAGIAKAGLVMVPLNPRLTPAEAVHPRSLRRPRAWSSTTRSPPSRRPAVARRCRSSRHRRDPARPEPTRRRSRPPSPTDPRVAVGEHDPFCIAYTSGTTGRPKGVVITHRSRALTFYLSALEWGLGHRSALDRGRADVPRRRLRVRLRAGLHRRHGHHAARLGPRGDAGDGRAGPGAVRVPGADPRADDPRHSATGAVDRRRTSPAWTPSTSTPPRSPGRSRSG